MKILTRVHSLVAATALLMALSGCGGGGGTEPGSNDAGQLVSATATVSIDPRLSSASGALAIATVQSLVDSRPIGNSVGYEAGAEGAPVFALGTSGGVVLATRVANGNANFSAEGTVRFLAAMMLSTFNPNEGVSTLEKVVGESLFFAPAVDAFKTAFLAGINPTIDAAFQARLVALVRGVLSSRGTLMSATRATALALPPNRLDPATQDPVDRTVTLLQTVSPLFDKPWSLRLSNELVEKRYLLWNATPVFWDTRVTEVDGTGRDLPPLEPPPFVFGTLGIGAPEDIGKATKSFEIRVQPSYGPNIRKMIVSVIQLGFRFLPNPGAIGPACEEAIAQIVVESQVVSAASRATSGEALLNIVEDLLWGSPTLYTYCLSRPGIERDRLERLLTWVNWALAAVDLTEIGLQAKIWHQFKDTPVSTGVCVSASGRMSSCLWSIARAFDPPPLAAGAPFHFQVDRAIRFYNARGEPIALPADLRTEYLPESLMSDIELQLGDYDTNLGLTYTVIAKTGKKAEGIVRLRDPATDKSIDIPVKVSTGRLDPDNVTVGAGETIKLTLLEDGGNRPLVPPPPGIGLKLDLTNSSAAMVTDEVVDKTARISVTGKTSGQSSALFVINNLIPGLELARAQLRVRSKARISLHVDPTTTSIGATVSFTGTAMPPAGTSDQPTPSGTITIRDSVGNNLCTATLSALGVGTCTASFSGPARTETVVVSYGGDTAYFPAPDAATAPVQLGASYYWSGTMKIDTCTQPVGAGFGWAFENPCFTAGPSAGQYNGFIRFKDGDPRVVLGSNFGLSFDFTREDYSATFNLNWRSSDNTFYFERGIGYYSYGVDFTGRRRMTFTVTSRDATTISGVLSVSSDGSGFYQTAFTNSVTVIPTTGVGTFTLQLRQGELIYPP